MRPEYRWRRGGSSWPRSLTTAFATSNGFLNVPMEVRRYRTRSAKGGRLPQCERERGKKEICIVTGPHATKSAMFTLLFASLLLPNAMRSCNMKTQLTYKYSPTVFTELIPTTATHSQPTHENIIGSSCVPAPRVTLLASGSTRLVISSRTSFVFVKSMAKAGKHTA